MEKKLKRVQNGAAFGFVVLKILRILLIVAVVAMVAGLVALAVVNENDLPIDGIENGKLTLDLSSLELNRIGLDQFLDMKGELSLDLRDVKLVVMMLIGVGILAIGAAYVLLAIAGKLFKHMKKEDTPFTAGNVRRLRLLGIFHIVFWACGIALSYFVGSEFVRRLALPANKVSLSLNLSSLLIALVFFFLARLFSYGKAQGEALQAAAPAPAPQKQTKAEEKPVNLIGIDDFFKAELKTAKILAAEAVPGADKLLKLQIDVGGTPRQIVAGIAKSYTPESLIGRTIVIVANLQPAKIRGIESCGMLLAAKSGKELKLVTVDGEIASGASVG